MATEIERKFLVAHDGWRTSVEGDGVPIRQAYLSRPPAIEVRVRVRGDQGYLTIKGGRGAVRSEYEWPIGATDADELLALCPPVVISKTRYLVPHAGLTWEVDIFDGPLAGLRVAEVELDDVDAPIELPDWVGRELTGNDRYSNSSLSAFGLPDRAAPIYVASPLGFSDPGRAYSEQVLLPAMRSAGLEPIDPWHDPEQLLARAHEVVDFAAQTEAVTAANTAVGGRNADLIRSALGMLALLDGSDVDSGTAAEVGFAAALGLPVTGLRTDIRPAGDNHAATVNLQVEWFIHHTGGHVHRTLDGAVAEVVARVGHVSS